MSASDEPEQQGSLRTGKHSSLFNLKEACLGKPGRRTLSTTTLGSPALERGSSKTESTWHRTSRNVRNCLNLGAIYRTCRAAERDKTLRFLRRLPLSQKGQEGSQRGFPTYSYGSRTGLVVDGIGCPSYLVGGRDYLAKAETRNKWAWASAFEFPTNLAR
jgi:hypothetical protein